MIKFKVSESKKHSKINKKLFLGIALFAATVVITITTVFIIMDKSRLLIDFADDRISVVLNYEATFSGKMYGIEDFPELQLREVENLFSNPTEPYHRKILHLTLLYPSKVTVLEYISILKKRPDVENAAYSSHGSIPELTLYDDSQRNRRIVLCFLSFIVVLMLFALYRTKRHKSPNDKIPDLFKG